MFDTEKFIILISTRPSLWDTNSLLYRNKDAKKRDWDEICTEMFDEDWITFSEKRQKDITKELQKKWKNVKDCFAKYVKAGKDGKKYLYNDLMQFMLPTLMNGTADNAPQQTEYAENGELLPASETQDEKPVLKENSERRRIKISSHRPLINYPSSTGKNRSRHLDQLLAASSKRSADQDAEDDDKLFLLSMWPLMKRMAPANRIKTRIELMQVIQKNSLS